MEKPLLIYCYDAWCGWCYGFSAAIQKISANYAGVVDMEILSGGMIRPQTPIPISTMAPHIEQAYKNVENTCGVSFGEDFLWHIRNPDRSDWFPDSTKAAIALCIFKERYPERMFEMTADLHYSLFYEGRDLTDDEAYRHLLEKYAWEPSDFYEKLNSPQCRQAALQEFALLEKMGISGFPALLLQTPDHRFHWIARGYTPVETINHRIQEIISPEKN